MYCKLNLRLFAGRSVSVLADVAEALSERFERFAESNERHLAKVFAVKFAVTMAAIVTMGVLFVTRFHVFTPITSRFSEWVSSSLIAFALTVIVVKFAVVSVCLAMFALNRSRRERLLLWCRDLRTVRIPVLIFKKVRFHS